MSIKCKISKKSLPKKNDTESAKTSKEKSIDDVVKDIEQKASKKEAPKLREKIKERDSKRVRERHLVRRPVKPEAKKANIKGKSTPWWWKFTVKTKAPRPTTTEFPPWFEDVDATEMPLWIRKTVEPDTDKNPPSDPGADSTPSLHDDNRKIVLKTSGNKQDMRHITHKPGKSLAQPKTLPSTQNKESSHMSTYQNGQTPPNTKSKHNTAPKPKHISHSTTSIKFKPTTTPSPQSKEPEQYKSMPKPVKPKHIQAVRKQGIVEPRKATKHFQTVRKQAIIEPRKAVLEKRYRAIRLPVDRQRFKRPSLVWNYKKFSHDDSSKESGNNPKQKRLTNNDDSDERENDDKKMKNRFQQYRYERKGNNEPIKGMSNNRLSGETSNTEKKFAYNRKVISPRRSVGPVGASFLEDRSLWNAFHRGRSSQKGRPIHTQESSENEEALPHSEDYPTFKYGQLPKNHKEYLSSPSDRTYNVNPNDKFVYQPINHKRPTNSRQPPQKLYSESPSRRSSKRIFKEIEKPSPEVYEYEAKVMEAAISKKRPPWKTSSPKRGTREGFAKRSHPNFLDTDRSQTRVQARPESRSTSRIAARPEPRATSRIAARLESRSNARVESRSSSATNHGPPARHPTPITIKRVQSHSYQPHLHQANITNSSTPAPASTPNPAGSAHHVVSAPTAEDGKPLADNTVTTNTAGTGNKHCHKHRQLHR